MCGQVKFGFEWDDQPYGVCHCPTCQKASGAAFTANIPVDADRLRILSGENRIKRYESSEGKYRCFCNNCGSPLFAHLGTAPSVYRVRLGCLDTPMERSPACHFFTGYSAHWYSKADDLPSFKEWPDPEVLVLKGSKHQR
jgi:hypothetical protein